MAGSRPHTRVVSPPSFPLDPRYEQTRTPLNTIHPRDRVLSKCNKRTESRLLTLPGEILAHITRCLAEIDQGHHLPNFALSHSECRQLARPFQFADVWIMDGELPWSFLRFLKDEDADDGSLPSIGSCIRRLTFTFRSDFTHFTTFGSVFEGWDEASEKWYDYWRGMVADLAQVIQHKLPVLESVHWQEVEDQLYYVTSDDDPAAKVNLMPAILERATSAGRVRTLYLEDDSLYVDNAGLVTSLLPGDEPLRLTDLAIGCSRFESGACSVPASTYLYETILRRSADSLESVAFNPSEHGDMESDDDPNMMVFRDGRILFPRLRKFWTSQYPDQTLHPDVVESFLSATIESFAPSLEVCSIMTGNQLVDKYPLPRLRTFAVVSNGADRSGHPEHVDKCLQLAQVYGHQLEELFVYLGEEEEPEGETIPFHLVTHLSSGAFTNLRSLCFAWSFDPDLRVFRATAKHLPALQELSFGFEPLIDQTGSRLDGLAEQGWQRSWKSRVQSSMPSHPELQAAISPLLSLERLCIFGDEYVADFAGKHWAWHRFMKEHVWYHQGRSATDRKVGNIAFTGQAWSEGKRGHKKPGDCIQDWATPFLTGLTAEASAEDVRRAAQDLGAEYAETLPKLRELMVGRVLVEVVGR